MQAPDGLYRLIPLGIIAGVLSVWVFIPSPLPFPRESTDCKHCGREIPLSLEDSIYPRHIMQRRVFIESLDCKKLEPQSLDILYFMVSDTKDPYNADTCAWVKSKLLRCSLMIESPNTVQDIFEVIEKNRANK